MVQMARGDEAPEKREKKEGRLLILGPTGRRCSIPVEASLLSILGTLFIPHGNIGMGRLSLSRQEAGQTHFGYARKAAAELVKFITAVTFLTY